MPELPQPHKPNIFESQLTTLSRVDLSQFRPEVGTYLQNLITQAQGILTSHQDLNTAPIETLQLLQSLITKLKHVAKTKEFPLEDDPYKFIVAGAINPYEEVYTTNNLPVEHEITLELDLKDILESDREAYAQSNLPEWANALPNTFTIPPESRKLIEQELKAGAIPIFMPSSQVQQETLLKALTSLKPTWIKEGVTHRATDPYIWDHIQNLITTKDPTLTANLPDKPYILLIKPTQRPPVETTEKTLEQQKAYLAQLQQDDPHVQSILLQEYAALQDRFTQRILQESLLPAGKAGRLSSQPKAGAPRAQGHNTLTTLDPLDKDTYTKFITLPVSADRRVLFGGWYFSDWRVNFDGFDDAGLSDSVDGFRLAVRAEIEIRSYPSTT